MTHTPINRIGYPTADDNHAPQMLAYAFLGGCICYAAGIATVLLMMVAM